MGQRVHLNQCTENSYWKIQDIPQFEASAVRCFSTRLRGYGWVFGQVETQNNSYFEVLMLDANKGPRDCPFRVFVVGRNVW